MMRNLSKLASMNFVSWNLVLNLTFESKLNS